MSARLAALAALVGPARRVIDVGCEHGRLAPLLAADWVLGIDCRPHLLRSGAGPRLAADGLGALAAADAVVVCAGLGERSIARILAAPALARCRRLVLNPSPQPYALRAVLLEHGWYCQAENLVHSGGRYHVLIAAERGPEPCADPDLRLLGPRLFEQRHALLRPWLEDCCRRRASARGDSPEARFVAAARRRLDLA